MPLHDHEQQVCDERHPDLYLDGICALSVEVTQREVLLELLEQELYFPALAIDGNDVLHFHVHVVGKQGYKLCLPLLDVSVCDDACMMFDVLTLFEMLSEDDELHAVFHRSLGMHVHDIAFRLIDQVFLHLRDVGHFPSAEFLELGVVNVCPVQCDDVAAGIVRGTQHKAVVGGCRGEADVRRNALVGVDVGMHLDSALLLPCLRMPAHTLEDEVGEQRDGRRVDDLQAFQPCRDLPASAVRGKFALIGGIQVPVYGLKDALLAAGIGIRQG